MRERDSHRPSKRAQVWGRGRRRLPAEQEAPSRARSRDRRARSHPQPKAPSLTARNFYILKLETKENTFCLCFQKSYPRGGLLAGWARGGRDPCSWGCESGLHLRCGTCRHQHTGHFPWLSLYFTKCPHVICCPALASAALRTISPKQTRSGPW